MTSHSDTEETLVEMDEPTDMLLSREEVESIYEELRHEWITRENELAVIVLKRMRDFLNNVA